MQIPRIPDLNREVEQQCRQHLDTLTKPLGSLGRLESLAVQLAAITGEIGPDLRPRTVVVMAGDHGVVQQGVTSYPSEVTMLMVQNFLGGGAAINVLARHAGAEVLVVDMGVATELAPADGLLLRNIGRGTADMTQQPAMTREQAERAIETGIAIATDLTSAGQRMLITGEMGIGNTTPSAAIVAVMTGATPAQVTGRGAGLDDPGLERKVNVIETAIELHQPSADDAIDVLAKVGGFEIGGLAGLILGGAAAGVPVVVDGFISTAAALIAAGIDPAVKPYLISGHRSQEPGHTRMLSHLGLEPLVNLDLRLGEGTGATLALHFIDASSRIVREMATFADLGIEPA